MANLVLLLLSVVSFIGTTVSFPHFEGKNEEPIVINQHTPIGTRHKRSAEGFPDRLDISLVVEGVPVGLALIRNLEIADLSAVLVNSGDRVVRHEIPMAVLEQQAVAYYYERNNGSSFMIWHTPGQQESEDKFILFGIFYLGPREYQVQPLDPAHATHTLSLIPDPGPRLTDFVYSNSRDSPTFQGRADRIKRDVTAYEVETFFVVDYAVYSFWDSEIDGSVADRANVILNTIKQFYAFVLNTINARYDSVKGRGYTMTCLYSGIYIANASSAAPFIEDNLIADDGSARRKADVDVILPAFRDWANTNLAPTIDYDHAFLYTGHDLGAITEGVFGDSVAGYAYVGDVCGSDRYSINEDHFDASIGTVGAHELGHNLGADHDGTGNLCSGSDGYIMAATSTLSTSDFEFNKRQFVFSSCSVDYFDSMLATLGSNNCLENRSSSYNTTALDEFSFDLAGQTYPPDQQCGFIIGQGSYLFRASYANYEDICGVMYCTTTSNDGASYGVLAWEGTSCGNGKLCVNGSCVTSPSAPNNLTETCLFGEIPYNFPNESQTCVELLGAASQSYYCYNDDYRMLCCQSCDVHRQNNVNRAGCEYGDKADWCATLSLSDCYNNNDTCCQSCEERALSDPDCPYGDRLSGCDAATCHYYSDEDRTVGCCGTCAESTNTTATTSATTTSTTTTTTTTTPTTTITATNATTASNTTTTATTTATNATIASNTTTTTASNSTTSSEKDRATICTRDSSLLASVTLLTVLLTF